jgi:hypothetical protein
MARNHHRNSRSKVCARSFWINHHSRRIHVRCRATVPSASKNSMRIVQTIVPVSQIRVRRAPNSLSEMRGDREARYPQPVERRRGFSATPLACWRPWRPSSGNANLTGAHPDPRGLAWMPSARLFFQGDAMNAKRRSSSNHVLICRDYAPLHATGVGIPHKKYL